MYYSNLIKIGRTDKVLEIGPGGSPFWRSDVVADKFDNNDVVVPGTFGANRQKTNGKPFYKIVDNKLPFQNNAFDYIICSHVLEHVNEDELQSLLDEIFRVAPKAYIEFPAPLYDIIFNYKAHVNFLTIEDNSIICLPKKHCNISKYQKYFQVLFNSHGISHSKKNKKFFTVGKEFLRESYSLTILKNEEEFFDLLAHKIYYPKSPTLFSKVYHKMMSFLK